MASNNSLAQGFHHRREARRREQDRSQAHHHKVLVSDEEGLRRVQDHRLHHEVVAQ